MTNHPCSGKRKLALVDKDTGETLATSLKQAVKLGFVEKQQKPAGELGTPPISPDGDASVLDGYRGYEPDKEAYLFIRLPNGKIRDFRLEFPEVYSLYKMCKKQKDIRYNGDFVHFMADCAQTMFAIAGYDLLITPKSVITVYDEAARLVKENKLIPIFSPEGQLIKLEVSDNRTDVKDSAGGVQEGQGEHQPKGLPTRGEEGKTGKSQ